MKQLAKEIKGRGSKKGTFLKQLKASKHAYLYECTGENFNPHYEVFMHKENTYFNCVSYPTDEAFGKWAWTFNKYSEALYCFDVLNMEANDV